MIKKEGDKFCVYDSTGKKKLGTHDSEKSALKQLAAIEISKKNKFADGGLKQKLACNKPQRSSDSKKTHVVKACQDGEEKLVRFGHKMPDGTSDPERKKSYCARSKGIGKLKDKLSANYWSRKNWKCND
jgi:hypothetical protein